MAQLKLTQLKEKELNDFINHCSNIYKEKIKPEDTNIILTPTVKGYLVEVKIKDVHKDITDTTCW